jgi:glycosyltransferase involved in cell wall biosynthesis
VVIVMIEPPLPFGNAVSRSYHVLVRGLVERGHRVTTFATCSRPEDRDATRDLFPAPAFDVRPYAHPSRSSGLAAKLETVRRPFSYMFSRELRDDLRRTLENGFDVLHLEQTWSGWLGLDHADRTLLNVLSSYAVDLADDRPGATRDRVARWLAIRAERALTRRYRHVRTCSERLAEMARAWNPTAEITTVPLGINLELYDYVPDERRTAEPVVSLIGSMNWAPSLSAAERLLDRLWPAIREQVPEATLQVVGWEARRALARFLDLPGVEIVESVPTTRPYFERAGVILYAPSQGSGMKVKVQEAMAYGVPVVTNRDGAEGLPARDGIEAGIAEDDAGLVARTVALLRDPARRDRQRAAARSMLQDHCTPGPILDAIETIHRRIASTSGSGSGSGGKRERSRPSR